MSLQAAFATRNITPTQPLFLVGYPHVERTSTGVHDPLLAVALHLQDGADALMMLAVDILFIDPQTAREVRAEVARRTGVPANRILISCTHTHSGPYTIDMLSFQSDPVVPLPDPEYMALFKQALIEAACESASKLEPAEIAVTTAQIQGIGGNRVSLDGPQDAELGLLVIRSRSDRSLLGLSITYAMHPTVLHEDSTLISGDFPGLARMALVGAFATPPAILYHMGTAGNQSPRNFVRANTFAEAQRLGEILAHTVQARINALQDADYQQNTVLAGATARVDLPRRRFPDVQEAAANLARCRATYQQLQQGGAGHGPMRTAECAVFGAEEAVFLAQCQANGKLDRVLADYLPAEIIALRLGDTAIVGLPGEIFVEYGLEIKRRLHRQAIVISLANGDLQGYIVTPEAVVQGTYEANNSLFSAQAGTVLCEAAVALANSLFTA